MLKDVFPIEGKTVLIIGANGWLGRRMSWLFAGCGANLILMGRSVSLHESVKQIQKKYPELFISGIQCNNNSSYFEVTLQNIVKKNNIDVLVNNAYILSSVTGFGKKKCSYTNWVISFDCLYWTVQATDIISEAMKKNSGGSIINVGSMYSLIAPNPKLYEGTEYMNPPSYSTIKAGLLGYTRYSASFLGRYGIRVNAICPGAIPNKNVDELFRNRLEERTLLGRVGTPKDLDGAMILLATAPYITGQSIVIDGGWTIC